MLVDHAPREQPETVAGVVRRQTREMIEREIGGAHQYRLEPGAADHAAARHEAAGADDVAAGLGARDHGVKNAGIVVVVRRQHDRKRRLARGKAGEHGAMGAAPAVAHECDRQRAQRRAIVA